jgi:hypothetical protein
MKYLLILLLCCSLVFADQISQEQVGASADDVVRTDGVILTVAGTTMSIGRNASNVRIRAGMRFTTVPIPAGSTIDTVIMNGISGTNNSTTTVNWAIRCEDTADATTFSDSTDFNARNKTTASYYWANLPAFTAGTTYRLGGSTANVKDPFVELFARGDWATGNDLVVFVEDSGSSTNTVRNIRTYNYAGNVSGLTLDIYYTTPSGVHMVFHSKDETARMHSKDWMTVHHGK